MMTTQEMQLAVCEKLPELYLYNKYIVEDDGKAVVIHLSTGEPINWPTEGLQVCHEAEKLLSYEEKEFFTYKLYQNQGFYSCVDCEGNDDWNEVFNYSHATYEQRLESLCRVWWPERFN